MIDFGEYCDMMDRWDVWTDKTFRPSLRGRWVSDSAPSTLQIDSDTIRSNVRIEGTILIAYKEKRYRFSYGPDADGVYVEINHTVDLDDPCSIVGSPEHIQMKREQIDNIVKRVIEEHKRRAEQKASDAIKKYNINPATKKEEKLMHTNSGRTVKWMMPTVDGGLDIQDIQVYNNKVVKVIFSDGSFTKAVCGENDNFDLDVGITICVIKRMVGSGKVGHVWYNNLIRKAHQVMDDRAEEKKMFAKIEAERKERIKKEQEKRKAGREKAKQEQIDIHSEAFLKALQEWKAAGGTCDLGN